jgi:hypothetical protein
MSFSLSKAGLALAASAFVALATCGARADEPSPAALGYAKVIFTDMGLKPAMDRIVPTLLTELERNVTTTHPELKAPLDDVLKAIEPEFIKTEEDLLNDVAKYFASQMTEQELKDVAAFYESSVGKKFMAAQPNLTIELGVRARDWRAKLETDILKRAREEMAKKGYSF